MSLISSPSVLGSTVPNAWLFGINRVNICNAWIAKKDNSEFFFAVNYYMLVNDDSPHHVDSSLHGADQLEPWAALLLWISGYPMSFQYQEALSILVHIIVSVSHYMLRAQTKRRDEPGGGGVYLLESMICTTLCCEETCIEFTMAADCMLPDSICLVFLSRLIQNFMYAVDLYRDPSSFVQQSSKQSCGSMWYFVVLRSSRSVWWKASLCGANTVMLVWFCKYDWSSGSSNDENLEVSGSCFSTWYTFSGRATGCWLSDDWASTMPTRNKHAHSIMRGILWLEGIY